MKAPPIPADEAERLAALERENVLDTPPDSDITDIAKVASVLCETPIAIVTLVDSRRQWFKAQIGIEGSETPREVSFCGHTILGRDVFVVPDAHVDERFADNPLVTGAPEVRFYAGAPLVTDSGHALGALCVIDSRPRQLSEAQIDGLRALSRQVISSFALRRTVRQVEVEAQRARAATTEARSFFTLNLDLLCIARMDGTIKDLNPAWSLVLGYSEDELRARGVVSIMHPDDRAASAARGQSHREGVAPPVARVRLLHADGHYVPFDIRSVADREQGLVYVVARDVSDHVRIEERTRRILDASASGMLLVESGGHITYANAAAAALLGEAAEALRGVSLAELLPGQNVSPQFSSGELLRDELVRGELHRYGAPRPASLRRRDGLEREIELSFTEVSTADGSAMVATLVDVSARRAVERMKDEFVSTVSHELRTPLTAIRGSLRLLDAGMQGALPPRAADLVRIAAASTERLVRLVNDVLDVARMESGKLELTRRELELETVVRTAIDSVRGARGGDDVCVELELGDVRTVTGDSDRLVQVLVNLISNAVKFSPPSSVVYVSAARVGDATRVSVRDRGPGIAPSDRARLFERFTQLDARDARAKGGSGLGLSIARGLVEAHGGRIGLDSTLGEGSTFWFELPP